MKAWVAAAAFFFAAGDYCGILWPEYLTFYCTAAVIFLFLLILGNKFNEQGRAAAVCGILLFCFCGAAAGSKAVQPDENAVSNYIGSKLTVYGNIDLLSLKQRSDGVSFILDCDAVQSGEGKIKNASGKIRVFARDAGMQNFISGSAKVTGELKAVHGFANPGSFDSESWNLQQGIQGRVSVPASALKIAKEPGFSDKFFRLALQLRQKITGTVQGEAGAVLCGMALGRL